MPGVLASDQTTQTDMSTLKAQDFEVDASQADDDRVGSVGDHTLEPTMASPLALRALLPKRAVEVNSRAPDQFLTDAVDMDEDLPDFDSMLKKKPPPRRKGKRLVIEDDSDD